jgi:hypothetical protein
MRRWADRFREIEREEQAKTPDRTAAAKAVTRRMAAEFPQGAKGPHVIGDAKGTA